MVKSTMTETVSSVSYYAGSVDNLWKKMLRVQNVEVFRFAHWCTDSEEVETLRRTTTRGPTATAEHLLQLQSAVFVEHTHTMRTRWTEQQ